MSDPFSDIMQDYGISTMPEVPPSLGPVMTPAEKAANPDSVLGPLFTQANDYDWDEIDKQAEVYGWGDVHPDPMRDAQDMKSMGARFLQEAMKKNRSCRLQTYTSLPVQGKSGGDSCQQSG